MNIAEGQADMLIEEKKSGEGVFAAFPGWDLLFTQNANAMFVCDRHTGQIVTANLRAQEDSRFDQQELVGFNVTEVLIGMTVNGFIRSETVSLRRKEGSPVPVQVMANDLEVGHRDLRVLTVQRFDPTEGRLSAFSALGHRLCSARTHKDAIQIILDTADQFFGWDACTFDRYSARTGLIQPVIVVDRVDGERRNVEPVVRNAEPTARMRKVLQEGPQLILRKAPVQMSADAVPMGDQSRPSASIMWVPIRTGSDVVGLLSIQSYALDAYSHEDLQLLQALADHGAGALERIQAEAEVQALNIDLESRVQERTSALQAAVRELEAFSYSISHDMRAPLRAMEGYTRKLLEDYSGKLLDETGIQYLERISRAAIRLDMLIQDVLTYTNVARTSAPLAPVDMERLMKDLMETYPEWRAPNVTIEVLSPLPVVLGNEALLTQCISHVIDNALKFVAPGNNPLVRVRGETTDDKVRIWIEDNGAGIDEKDHDRVFRMFERIHPAADLGGTGVGLTIVKKAVERMNGKVGFESELGKGCKFWFELSAARQL